MRPVFSSISKRVRRQWRYQFGGRRRAKVRQFRDIHRGRHCFVLGNGPSLNAVDLVRLNREYTFGVNGIHLAHEDKGFEPTYYIVEDGLYLEQHASEINKIDYSVRFFPERYSDFISQPCGDTYFLLFDWSVYNSKLLDYRNPNFSTDVEQRTGTGGSIIFVALQLAYYMGFDPVYLVGMDHTSVIPPGAVHIRNNRYRFEGKDPNHFRDDYVTHEDVYLPDRELINRGFTKAREAFERDGRSVLNATVGGKLEVFKRVDLDSVIS